MPLRDVFHSLNRREFTLNAFQSEVAHLLRSLLTAGRVITECPLSTSDGVKALDVAWLRPGRAQELRSTTCLVRAPEIVLRCFRFPTRQRKSPSTSRQVHKRFGPAIRTEPWSSTFLRPRRSGKPRKSARNFHQLFASPVNERVRGFHYPL
jgi:hypothetical protein